MHARFCQRAILLLSTFVPAAVAQIQPWARTYGGEGAEMINGLVQSDGTFLACGFSDSAGLGGIDLWVAAMNANGVPLWQTVLGGASTDEARQIAKTSDGGCVVAGYTYSFGAGGSDGWIVRLDAAGDVVWQKTYGGRGFEGFLAIAESPNGFYVGGAVDFQQAGQDVWILEIDGDGEVLWQQTFEGNQFDQLTSIAPTSDGLAIVANSNSDLADRPANIPFHRPWLTSLDLKGQVRFSKTYNFSGGDAWNHIEPLTNGGFVVTGEILAAAFFRGDLWITRLDEAGEVLWDQRFGDNFGNLNFDGGAVVRQTPDGGFLSVGSTATGGAGSQDLWLVKVDANGVHQWDRTVGHEGFESGNAALIVDEASVLIAGSGRLFFPEPFDALAIMLGLDGSDGMDCQLTAPGSPNIWTSTLEIAQVEITPKPTGVLAIESNAPVVEIEGSVLLCGRPLIQMKR